MENVLEVLDGYVDKIVYRNEENGYTVLTLLNEEEEEITCVGIFSMIGEGEFIEIEGNYVEHSVYGKQLKMEKYTVKEPEDLFSMERYLGSGAIKGIGTALAARIVRKFKKDTFRIIEEEPERLVEIKGISERIAREIAVQFEEKKEMRGATVFLQKYGISLNLAMKIYKTYGANMYEIIQKNPYRLADDIQGVGFKLADEIAVKVGIGADAEFRIKAGILYILQQASVNGHVYLPKEMLLEKTRQLLLIQDIDMDQYLMDMTIEKRVVVKQYGEEVRVYDAQLYYTEMNSAKMLLDLNISYDLTIPEFEKSLSIIEQQNEITLDQMQRTAVLEAARNGVAIVTGGPGTGKTTTINAMIKFFEKQGMDILLAAPTGRAAKRMSETTGWEAQTIHRLLELNGNPEEQKQGMRFERNEECPLEADVVIIDEMSMVDIHLMYALLKAVLVGTRLILVGDVNQLPSVGPGNVLKDLIASHCFNVVKLTKIFRQAAESDIIVNAHKINAGEQIILDNKSRDFFLLQRDNSNVIISVIIQLMKEKLPKYVNATTYDIQVLTPMRKGELGVERLNKILQEYLNPKAVEKREKEIGQTLFREGDKVMQIKNNYQIPWEIRNKNGIVIETGTGVFNGDCGVIQQINLFSEIVIVEYEEGKMVEYAFSAMDELELAYAITIHKSQGSEYPAVVMPILTGPRMLFNRNLLYTAVTRAKSCVTIVGSKNMIEKMIENTNEQKRYSGLCTMLMEMDVIS